MWVYFLHSTLCMQVPFIVHEGIKQQMNTSVCSQCPILFPCFFYNPYISLFNSKNFSFTCLRSFFTCYQHVCKRITCLYLQKVTASFLPSCSICGMYISQYTPTHTKHNSYLNSTSYQSPAELCSAQKSTCVAQVSSVQQGHRIPEWSVASFF